MTTSAVIHEYGLTNMMFTSRIFSKDKIPIAQVLLFTSVFHLSHAVLCMGQHELVKLLNDVYNVVNPSSFVKHSDFNPLL